MSDIPRRKRHISPQTNRDDLLATTLERDWQRHIMLKTAEYGGHGFHITISKGTLDGVHYDGTGPWPRRSDHNDAVGIPDLLLVFPERGLLLLPELKTPTGRVSRDQDRWIRWLQTVEHVATGVWRPGDERAVDDLLAGR